MTWHILPVDDVRDHEESVDCPCEPEIQFMENGDLLVVHNAFDKREEQEKLLEEAQRDYRKN